MKRLTAKHIQSLGGSELINNSVIRRHILFEEPMNEKALITMRVVSDNPEKINNEVMKYYTSTLCDSFTYPNLRELVLKLEDKPDLQFTVSRIEGNFKQLEKLGLIGVRINAIPKSTIPFIYIGDMMKIEKDFITLSHPARSLKNLVLDRKTDIYVSTLKELNTSITLAENNKNVKIHFYPNITDDQKLLLNTAYNNLEDVSFITFGDIGRRDKIRSLKTELRACQNIEEYISKIEEIKALDSKYTYKDEKESYLFQVEPLLVSVPYMRHGVFLSDIDYLHLPISVNTALFLRTRNYITMKKLDDYIEKGTFKPDAFDVARKPSMNENLEYKGQIDTLLVYLSKEYNEFYQQIKWRGQ